MVLDIKKVVKDDVSMVAILFDAYRVFYKQSSNLQAAFDFLEQRVDKNESTIFVATIQGEAVGFVQLYPSYDTITLKQIWILHDLFVIPSARQKGIAKSLLERARRLAEETHAKGLILETAVSNDAAQKLYEKLGWKRESDYYRYYLHL